MKQQGSTSARTFPQDISRIRNFQKPIGGAGWPGARDTNASDAIDESDCGVILGGCISGTSSSNGIPMGISFRGRASLDLRGFDADTREFRQPVQPAIEGSSLMFDTEPTSGEPNDTTSDSSSCGSGGDTGSSLGEPRFMWGANRRRRRSECKIALFRHGATVCQYPPHVPKIRFHGQYRPSTSACAQSTNAKSC